MQHIAIIRTSSIGDVILATACLNDFESSTSQDIKISWLGKEPSLSLIKKSYSILNVAKMFDTKIKYLPRRAGERYISALASRNLSNKIHKYFGSIKLKDYINKIVT